MLVGLTPLVPVPILDDRLRAYFERRLAREIAASTASRSARTTCASIGEGPGGTSGPRSGRGALLLPVRLLLRKVFLFLNVKRASDAASAAYHRGYLLDVALAAKAHPPHRGAGELRAAIDATLEDTPHSPIGTAVRLSFEGSKALLAPGAGARSSASSGGMSGTPTEVDLAQAVKESEERDVFARSSTGSGGGGDGPRRVLPGARATPALAAHALRGDGAEGGAA